MIAGDFGRSFVMFVFHGCLLIRETNQHAMATAKALMGCLVLADIIAPEGKL